MLYNIAVYRHGQIVESFGRWYGMVASPCKSVSIQIWASHTCFPHISASCDLGSSRDFWNDHCVVPTTEIGDGFKRNRILLKTNSDGLPQAILKVQNYISGMVTAPFLIVGIPNVHKGVHPLATDQHRQELILASLRNKINASMSSLKCEKQENIFSQIVVSILPGVTYSNALSPLPPFFPPFSRFPSPPFSIPIPNIFLACSY